MTYGRLKTWSDMEDAGELILFMTSQKHQIEMFLNQPSVKTDWMTLLMKSLNHAITAQHQKESIKNLLDSLCTTRFFEHFSIYIQEKRIGGYWQDANEYFTSSFHIFDEMLNKLPQYALKCYTGLESLLNAVPSVQAVERNTELVSSITELLKKAVEVHLSEKEKEKRPTEGKFVGGSGSDKPPDNFVDLPVVPSKSDLSEDAKPFLRRAKVVGQYDDVEHYLDVQFRLMRQDFVLPLREGIVEFKKNGSQKNYTCSDLRIYYDVHIVGTVFKDGIDHILQFDISKLKNVRWEFSKRLIFGSLLCLSKDNFETVIFATVANRDAQTLAKGSVNVNFKTGLEDVFNSTSNDVYIMAETTAYFESYCHVLEGLKEMTKNLPLQDYIIKCRSDLKPPRYLLPSGGISSVPMYDVSALMSNKQHKEVAALTTVSWPGTDLMCLNESQREAAILALTKELAIIQGPPGTGKTYVGLKVMQVLIENMHVISGSETETSPILVVCYTNHALDQFLEGVLEFCEGGIVRVGGKNKSEKLEPYNIKNLKLKVRKERTFSNMSVRHSIRDCLTELERVSEEIRQLNLKMDSLDIEVASENTLENFMNDAHFDSLTSDRSQPGQKKMAMRMWLNASNSTPASVLPQMIKKHLTGLVLQLGCASMNYSLVPGMDIIQRASLYNSYLALYKQRLQQDKLFLLSQPGSYGYLKEIQDVLAAAGTTILHDDLGVIPKELILQMASFLKSKDKLIPVTRGAIVEMWLLGLHRELHEQLDDVQLLTNLLSGETAGMDTFDDDDASKQAQSDRMIDDEDDDDANIYKTKSKVAMNNIASVILRAENLGIKEIDFTDENNEEDAGWKTVSHVKPLTLMKFQRKLKSTAAMTESMENSIHDVWSLDPNKRFALYKLWIQRYKESITDKMCDLVKQYTSAYERKKEINIEEVLFLMRSAKVIGMTTTGAAKHRAVLQSLGCRIVVVEEAAEVLESHIVTALNKNCKHLILIGDHQQLRPSPTVYLLAKEYGLEISLFERLIKNKVPHMTLKEQHRMRPEISRIMRHIYPDLQDHISVHIYDHIRGISKDIFFIQHEHKETSVDDTRSKANIHEAEFLVALCQYLLNQDYTENQITILATYAGQILAIKKVMKTNNFNHRVRVTAVDNFQGEENEIILLSMVRSNEKNNVGFLKVDNRVCVALSRAKKGLYIIGNFDLLASQSTLWKNIVDTATQEKIIGDGLPVSCQHHPEHQEKMTCAEDFIKRPDGGCGRPCDYRLTCGHVCGRKCHGYDLNHETFQCRKPCAKKCPEDHPCLRKCYQDCGDCRVKVIKKIPICGHEDEVPCSVPAVKAECSQKCGRLLECEHLCTGKCGSCKNTGVHQKCQVPVEYSWPCGHDAIVPCYMNPTAYTCQKMCGAVLSCGHSCTGKCYDCLEGSVHVVCSKKCNKKLPCGHVCPNFCGVPCLPCTVICPAECRHGACRKSKTPPKCSHACPPCKESCKRECIHQKCKKLCSDSCDMEPCQERCSRNVASCKHLCSGLCGELCVCAKCDKIEVLQAAGKARQEITAPNDAGENITVQDDDSSKADEKQDELQSKRNQSKHDTFRPILKIASCNHVFYVDELDNYVLNFDPDGTSFILCPVCSKPILKCMRYEEINKLRHRKREEKKVQLKLATEITKSQKISLKKSQGMLPDSLIVSGFRSIDLGDAKTQAEMHALSFKFKCAFVISEIATLLENDADSKHQLNSRKDAVLKIKDRLSNQQKLEFTTELLRCFWLAYVTHLEKLSNDHHIEMPGQLNSNVSTTKKDVGKLRPQEEILDRASHVSDTLRLWIREHTKDGTLKARCILLEDSAARVVKVMKSRDEDVSVFLYTFIVSILPLCIFYIQ